jgi:hypothetical protein
MLSIFFTGNVSCAASLPMIRVGHVGHDH